MLKTKLRISMVSFSDSDTFLVEESMNLGVCGFIFSTINIIPYIQFINFWGESIKTVTCGDGYRNTGCSG